MKKVMSKYFIFSIVVLSLGFVMGILGIVLNKYALIFLIIAMVLILLGVGLLFGDKLVAKDKQEQQDIDEANIIKSLDSYQRNNGKLLLKIKSTDDGIVQIADKVNDIIINDVVLEHGHIYDGSDFFMMCRKYMIKSGLEKFAIVRIYGISKKTIKPVIEKYPYCYLGKYDGYYDVLIEIFDKKELEEYLTSFVNKYKNVYGVIAYYDEYSMDEIYELLNQEVEGEREKMVILDRNSDKEVFNNVINKYRNVDLNKDNLVEDYLIDIFPYIPFTHMAILIDEEYLRLVNYKGALKIDEIQDVEFKTWLKLDTIKYLGKQVHIVYANDNVEVSVTPSLLYKLNKVNAILNNLVIVEMDKIHVDECENRFNNLELLHDSMSYEVDDDFKVIHASKRLNERYNNQLVGSYCYECLYGREEPCKNCPLKMEGTKTYMSTSHLYERVIEKDGKKSTVYLLSRKKPYINDRDQLNNRLLGLLNNPNAKGYLLVFKLDSIPQLAVKYKMSSEQIANSIIASLVDLGLAENLFRKEEDEFVYLLTYASMADAVRIAKDVSRAFLETFKVDDKEFNFLPKVILLSYPVEVNTLFSLDSLSRTLFSRINQKGMLYRVDELPTPIDDHRHYMEIVEEAFKNNEIPVSYFRIKDLENKYNMFFVGYKFLDENHNRIPDDQISLYVKIDKKYITFMDKFVRSFNFEDNDNRYVTSVGKEGLEKQMFDTLIGFFNSKHIPLNRVVFEAKEKDIHQHLDAVNYALDLGFSIAIDLNDSGTHNLDMSRFVYIRIDGRRLSVDKSYQSKINSVVHGDKPILMEEKFKDLIIGARFVY